MQRMSISVIVLAALLLFTTVTTAKEEPTIYSDAREFYHDLSVERQQRLLLEANLQDPEQAAALGRLLSDQRFNIQKSYDEGCKGMTEGRAEEILELVKIRKDLEVHLLGPACLSPVIIGARKRHKKWPPSDFPLLVDCFGPKGIATTDIKDILREALKNPSGWRSDSWKLDVDWNEMMDDLRFWRMIGAAKFILRGDLSLYLKRAFLQKISQPTLQDLEELFMKSFRLQYDEKGWKEVLNKGGVDENARLHDFSPLQDPWSVKVRRVLEMMYSKDFKIEQLPGIFLDSGLVQLDSWRGDTIDLSTAVNDILELFTVAIGIKYSEELEKALYSLCDQIVDWSIVRPLVLAGLTRKLSFRRSTLWNLIDRAVKNPTASAVLQSIGLTSTRNYQMYKHHLTFQTHSIRGQFADQKKGLGLRSIYEKLLYGEWKGSKMNWPGHIAAHNNLKGTVRGVFKPSEIENSTFDPKTDETYDEHDWELAFDSIGFDVTHEIASSTVPSICFLRALLYYRTRRWAGRELDWTELMAQAGEKCIFPPGKEERARYLTALIGAIFGLSHSLGHLLEPGSPISNAEIAQALIRGDDEESIKVLASKMANATLQ